MSNHNRNLNRKAVTKKDLIVNTLTEQIEAGELPQGARLAGENALATQFHVSRGTVREALSVLKRRHMIETRGGVGSVVIYDGQTIDQAAGWTAALSSISESITTTLLSIGVVPRAQVPELPEGVDGSDFVQVVRRRDTPGPDGQPQTVSLERSYVPNVGELARLPETGLYLDSLTATLARAGLDDAAGEQSVALRVLDADEAKMVGRPQGTPFLRAIRTSFTPGGGFVEHVVSLLDPAHFTVSSKFGSAL
ncbi:MAG: GntR family transcriptional regulator [Bifidobacteriaceae bacterium]|jgi:GntR family transcriptional regulator|nr:GntR family transcriptional regulator [Bifidobacteriaceae bacterium]